jgi:hypothetical protein
VAIALVTTSCTTVQSVLRMPASVARQIAPGGDGPKMDMDTVSLSLMRFADVSALRITEATDDFAARVGTPEARIQALVWRIDYSRALYRLAAGPQPFEGLFSTIVIVSVLRRNHEERGLATWGEPGRVMLDALRRIEEGGWELAEAATSESNVQQARRILAVWLEGVARGAANGAENLPAFGEIIESVREDPFVDAAGLFDLVTLDPLAGLEPAVAEVARSRRLGERALYFLEHMPTLLSAQVELMGLKSASSPAVQGALSDWQRFAASAASLSETAAGLPGALSAEREALLAQLGSEITAQREGLLGDLETAREPLHEILLRTQGAAVAGRDMSVAATQALEAGTVLTKAIDEMIATLRDEGGKAAAGDPARPPRRRFDITEYTAAAESVSKGAQALTETIANFNRTLPELQLLLREAVAQSDRTVDRAFWRAVQLLSIALFGGALVTLAVRRISMRWNPQQIRSGGDGADRPG